ncbi:MAG TPA: hypothetical protein PKN96_12320 [Flavobacterium sp.]|uniref:hypothetical protein n=1 Tax=Flavobacterium sp. TaxID=239 RepID=UPI002C0CBD08|nr:hypothetical protein [Flavobacterium sp.]HNP34069.1 hypothetical protein [Flavobacterium sp.]
MKYVLKEYLLGLKEDRELDAFCKELLVSRNLIPLTKIQRGRQYGVDLAAIGQDEDGIRKVYLLVIKQGDLTRKIWDGGNPTDVRPSLNEIRDVYLKNSLPETYKHLPVKIIVCFNGEFENSVLQNWSGYVDENTTEKIGYEYWGVDRLVHDATTFQANEELLPYDLALKFRKVLAFIDMPDYPLTHITGFLDGFLSESDGKISEKNASKKLRIINLCVNIIYGWCRNSNNLKPSYISIERILLYTFNWIYTNQLMTKKGVSKALYEIMQSWRHHNWQYANNVGDFSLIQDGLSYGIPNHDEYCLVTYEQIGIFSLIGLYEIWECKIGLSSNNDALLPYASEPFNYANAISIMLSKIIENNPSSLNPKYDEHCIEINLALNLLFEIGHLQVAVNWISELVNRAILNVKMNNFLPIRDALPEKLQEANAKEQTLSHYIYILAEWCIILKQIDSYQSLRELVAIALPKLDLQIWFPDEDCESKLFSGEASYKGGATMFSLELPEDNLKLEMAMVEERALFSLEDNYKFMQDGFDFIPFIASRHFRTYPFPNTWRSKLSSRFCFTKKENERQG